LFLYVPEQTMQEQKNPPDLLRRVYDLFFTHQYHLASEQE
jgi:hypothetical protein